MSMAVRRLETDDYTKAARKAKKPERDKALISPRVYDDGLTKQSFKDETDVNNIIAKAQKAGTLSHLLKYEGEYGDYSDVPDLLEANARLQRGQQIFNELPSEVRKEFGQDMSEFFAFVNNPDNVGKLQELLPDLAKPGRQHRILDPAIQQGIREAFEAAADGSSEISREVAEGGGETEPEGSE